MVAARPSICGASCAIMSNPENLITPLRIGSAYIFYVWKCIWTFGRGWKPPEDRTKHKSAAHACLAVVGGMLYQNPMVRTIRQNLTSPRLNRTYFSCYYSSAHRRRMLCSGARGVQESCSGPALPGAARNYSHAELIIITVVFFGTKAKINEMHL